MADTIDGFDLRRELGRGGFGVVHLAWQPALHREVAVKILTADTSDPAARARFERECQAIGSLSSHPHVVAVYGNGVTDEDRPYLVMEYLSGGTLADRGALSWQAACEVGVRIAAALTTAHRMGIIHRDVKPQNVLFTEFETPQLADFGIASIVDGFETKSNSVSASLAYAAPEVLDARPSSAQSDIYGLAATVVGAILGRGPFHRDADSIAGLVARVATAPVPDLRLEGVPDAVCTVLERAMAKRPEDRQPDAATFGRDLAAAAGIDPGLPLTGVVPVVTADADTDDDLVAAAAPSEAEPSDAEADGSTTAAGRSGSRRPLLIAAAAVAMLLVGGAAAIVAGGDDSRDLDVATVDDKSPTTTRRERSATTTSVPVSVLGETTIVGDPLATTVPGTPTVDSTTATGGGSTTGITTAGQRTTGTTRSSSGATFPAATGSTGGSTNTGGSTSGGSSGGTTAAPAAPAATAPATAPPTNAPATTAAPVGNQAPLLPAATFEFQVKINQNTVIVPDGDKRLSAGWSDPDRTSEWLCLQPLPQTTDWWVDGMNCEGSGLLVAATTPGVRILELRAAECTSANPGCGAPYSTTRRTVRVEFVP